MDEKIYTIPVNMAFEKEEGCPFCALYRELENTELDLILGASMMEPDIRLETNKKGFCKVHFDKMFNMKNRLGLGLMLESHIESIKKGTEIKSSIFTKDAGLKTASFLEKLDNSCYVCERVEGKISKMFSTAILLWETQKQFRENMQKQKYFCLPHYKSFLCAASKGLSKKSYTEFLEMIDETEMGYLEKLSKDVSWFCKKFDYRYDSEPWGESKDAVERAIKFLGGEN